MDSNTSSGQEFIGLHPRLLNQPLFSVVQHSIIDYPTPSNLSYLWNFGSLAGVCLIIQILTGIFLAMHYTPQVDMAFNSVEHIMRDVPQGWFLRYVHANGASMFFIIVYMHMLRGLYYGSYLKPRRALWLVGVVIFLLLMATAFMGYVLPWGQMSFWGATVITNLFSAIPIIGNYIVYWLWGGFAVDNATLNRFFSLHYLMPFVLAAFVGLHLILLHQHGSSNPLGIWSPRDRVSFTPYYYVKDVFGLCVFLIMFAYFIHWSPNTLGHPDNYVDANPLVTPPHIIPEWYFLPFYAILRSIPNKLGGIVAMFASILILMIIPFFWKTTDVRSSFFRPMHKKFFWLFIADSFILGWIGQKTPEYPYIQIGQIATAYYFYYFLFFLPVIAILESAVSTYSNLSYRIINTVK